MHLLIKSMHILYINRCILLSVQDCNQDLDSWTKKDKHVNGVLRMSTSNKKRIIPCNEGHDDFLYLITYRHIENYGQDIRKVCRSCYANEDCFNNKKFIAEIRTLDARLVWSAGLNETDSRNPDGFQVD